ncbi:diacylglycerol/lipid kinase family protein [Salsuginibacillus kocurii]|uniref:diacylglycerol/lipid kinase family protein n=1 Tax=Salsuginibacillus kocurii TaxID=427078 RepID=UPI000378A51D|nr:diacylglycerol kinase family protein [Salsuginibacillus kocurii]
MYGCIVNKVSGNGKGDKAWKQVEQALQAAEYAYTVRFTERPQHATELVEELVEKKVETIITIGGDGTIHEVANGLIGKDTALGLIPTGSGNDFARCLGVPNHYGQAFERIVANKTKQVDVLELEDKYCLTVTGIGFDGEVAKNVNRSSYKKYLNRLRVGGLSYVVSVLETLRTYQPTTVTITVDGNEMNFTDVWLVAVANAPNYGGGVMICPDATPEDGMLNLCVVHGSSKWELLRVFPQAYKGKHTTKDFVTLLEGKEVLIHSDPPVHVHSDGEEMKKSPLHIRVKKDALRVL